jgi:hypothetical protein
VYQLQFRCEREILYVPEEYVWEQEPERTIRRDEDMPYGVWEQWEPERTGFVILFPFCVFCVPLVVAGEAFLPKLFRVS